MHYHVSIFTLINAFNPGASEALRDTPEEEEVLLRSRCSTTNHAAAATTHSRQP